MGSALTQAQASKDQALLDTSVEAERKIKEQEKRMLEEKERVSSLMGTKLSEEQARAAQTAEELTKSLNDALKKGTDNEEMFAYELEEMEQSHSQAMAAFEEKEKNLLSELHQTQARVEELEGKVATQVDELAAAGSDNEQLRAELASAKTSNEDLTEQLHQLQTKSDKQISLLNKKLLKTTKSVTQMTDMLEESESKYNQLVKELERIKSSQ